MIARFLPQAGSAHAAALDAVLVAIHWHMLAVFVLWLAIMIAALVRFREGRQPQPSGGAPGWRWPLLAIAAVLVGDIAVLATRALPAWHARMAPPAGDGEAPLEVHVAAEQFAWQIHYPGPDGRFGRADTAQISASNPVGIDRADPTAADDIGLTNILVLPIGRPVVVQLTSRDVVHSFSLPEMRVKQDATPGLIARTWFTPIALGQWDIVCAQLCGLGHYRMKGEYRVVSRGDWEQWLADELQRLP